MSDRSRPDAAGGQDGDDVAFELSRGPVAQVADHPTHAILVCIGIVGAVAALVGAILVLATRDFGFSVDAEHLYQAAFSDREHPEIYLLRIAESHRQRRVANRDGVRALQRFLVAGLFGVVLEVAGFASALAVH